MSYSVDKEMIHRLGPDRIPTYFVVATATNSGKTQTIVAESPFEEMVDDSLVKRTEAEAKADCISKIGVKDAAITK